MSTQPRISARLDKAPILKGEKGNKRQVSNNRRPPPPHPPLTHHSKSNKRTPSTQTPPPPLPLLSQKIEYSKY